MKGKKLLLDASRISDFRVGIDRVIRRGNRCFIVSGGTDYRNTTATYADLEVKSDVLTDEQRANFAKLTSEQRIKMHDTIFHSPYLSMEGRNERLTLLDSVGTSGSPYPPSGVRP